MKTFINIRGTNGSGKSTLARKFFGEFDAEVNLVAYSTKSGTPKWATGVICPDHNLCVVGNYDTMAGGMDKIPSFSLQQRCVEEALALPEIDTVIGEGILASTVMGSWEEHAKKLHHNKVRVVWAFMMTPLDICVERVRQRPKKTKKTSFKVQLIEDKWKSINRVREKACLRSWIDVVELPYMLEYECLRAFVSGT